MKLILSLIYTTLISLTNQQLIVNQQQEQSNVINLNNSQLESAMKSGDKNIKIENHVDVHQEIKILNQDGAINGNQKVILDKVNQRSKNEEAKSLLPVKLDKAIHQTKNNISSLKTQIKQLNKTIVENTTPTSSEKEAQINDQIQVQKSEEIDDQGQEQVEAEKNDQENGKKEPEHNEQIQVQKQIQGQENETQGNQQIQAQKQIQKDENSVEHTSDTQTQIPLESSKETETPQRFVTATQIIYVDEETTTVNDVMLCQSSTQNGQLIAESQLINDNSEHNAIEEKTTENVISSEQTIVNEPIQSCSSSQELTTEKVNQVILGGPVIDKISDSTIDHKTEKQKTEEQKLDQQKAQENSNEPKEYSSKQELTTKQSDIMLGSESADKIPEPKPVDPIQKTTEEIVDSTESCSSEQANVVFGDESASQTSQPSKAPTESPKDLTSKNNVDSESNKEDDEVDKAIKLGSEWKPTMIQDKHKRKNSSETHKTTEKYLPFETTFEEINTKQDDVKLDGTSEQELTTQKGCSNVKETTEKTEKTKETNQENCDYEGYQNDQDQEDIYEDKKKKHGGKETSKNLEQENQKDPIDQDQLDLQEVIRLGSDYKWVPLMQLSCEQPNETSSKSSISCYQSKTTKKAGNVVLGGDSSVQITTNKPNQGSSVQQGNNNQQCKVVQTNNRSKRVKTMQLMAKQFHQIAKQLETKSKNSNDNLNDGLIYLENSYDQNNGKKLSYVKITEFKITQLGFNDNKENEQSKKEKKYYMTSR